MWKKEGVVAQCLGDGRLRGVTEKTLTSQQAKEYQKYIKKMSSLRSWIGAYLKFELLSCLAVNMTSRNSGVFDVIGNAYQ